MNLTIIRISIKKSIEADVRPYGQSAPSAFTNDYLVQTKAPFPSATLAIYAANIAQVESRLYPSYMRFESAHIKLVTPSLTPEELYREFVPVDLPNLWGQHPVAEDDGPAYPPVSAAYARGAQSGRGGRLALSYAITASEWILYTNKGILPRRFQASSVSGSPSVPSVSEQFAEAISAEEGSFVMSWPAGESDPRIRKITCFVFDGLNVASKPKRRQGAQTKQKAALRRAALQALKNGVEFDPEAALAALKNKGKKSGPSEGIVYLLKAGPHYKIGKSVNFEKRLTQIKLQLPHAVEVIHVIRAADHSKAESHWHRRFAAHRLNGEWFELSETDLPPER